MAKFDCVMDPPVVLKIGGTVPGLLSEVLVGRGDQVRKGDLIARLDSTIERASRDVLEVRARNEARIEAQRARLEFVVARRERIEKLLERGVSTQEAMDEVIAGEVAARAVLADAEVEKALAQKELARADAMLSLREIKSPVDGVIAERALGPGEYLHQDVHVATIVQLDPLHVEAFLPVAFYTDIVVGDVATIFPDAPVQGSYQATVHVVDRVFDAASSTFGIRLHLANADGALPAGHRCKVAFETISQADERLNGGIGSN